jgi:subtilisin family serine protease
VSIRARELDEDLEALRSAALQPVPVAIVDTGVDATHPDLAGRVARAWDVAPVGHGHVRVRERAPGAADRAGHGTAVASLVARVAPNARLWDLRALHADRTGEGIAFVSAFEHALRLEVPLFCLSLAVAGTFEARLRALCERAYRQGATVVAARRNVPLLHDGLPAGFSSVLSVDALRSDDPFELEYRAGEAVDFAGAGHGLRVAVPGGGRTRVDGTSYAAAAVTGLCALLLGRHASLAPFELKALLKAHARNG